MLFKESDNNKQFLAVGTQMGQTLNDRLRAGTDLNIMIARHAKDCLLRFCKKCNTSESYKHYVFYCQRFNKHCDILRDQLNHVNEFLLWDDIDIFEILWRF